MRRKICFGFVPLLFVLFLLGGHSPPELAGQATSPANVAATLANWVCPVDLIAEHGTYCSYYAINCKTKMPTPHSAECGLDLSGNPCGNPTSPPCTNVGTVVAAELQRNHYISPSLREKGVGHSKIIVNPIPQNKRSYCRLVGAPMLAEVVGPLCRAKFMLHLILVNPPDGGKTGPPMLMGTATHVFTRQRPDLEISEASVTIDKKTITITLGSVTYSGFLCSDEALKDPKDG